MGSFRDDMYYQDIAQRFRTQHLVNDDGWKDATKAVFDYARAEYALSLTILNRVEDKAEKLLTLSSAILAGLFAAIVSDKFAAPWALIPAVLVLLVLIGFLVSIRTPDDLPVSAPAMDHLKFVGDYTETYTLGAMTGTLCVATVGILAVGSNKGKKLKVAKWLLFATMVLVFIGLITSLCQTRG